MRLCILGTSHVGPLAVAFREMPDTAALPWQFYPVPNGFAGGAGLKTLTLDAENRQICGFPTRAPSRTRAMAVDDFDAFFLVGGQPSYLNHARLYGPRYSGRFSKIALDDMHRNCKGFHAYGLLRSLTDAPVHVACEYARLPMGKAPPPLAPEAEAGMAAFWKDQGATYLPQPAELLDEQGLTRPECFVAQGDHHLKPEYAAAVIRQLRQVFGV